MTETGCAPTYGHESIMARRRQPPPGKCVHCLRYSNKLTWDHVFPEAWYPDSTPANLVKWKIPACPNCNHEYGGLEDDLLWRLGMCVDPEDWRSVGITQKVMRSTNPLYAKNDRDRQARAAKRQLILKQVVVHDQPPTVSVLPNFGVQPHLTYDGYPVIPLPADNLIRLGQKIVRGLTYLERQFFIDDKYQVNVYFLENANGAEIVRLLEQRGTTHSKGPGIAVKHAYTDEGALASLWYIEIWGRLKMYGAVVPMHIAARMAENKS